MNISTELVYKAIAHYSGLGYKIIDVPLVVDYDVSAHTKPEGVPDLCHTSGKVYVASAEQSFIQLHKDGLLPNGKYMALTPCYRAERLLDSTHYLMFIKLELINVGQECHSVLIDSDDFFKNYVNTYYEGNMYNGVMDIISNGVELGSYGFRQMLDGTVYTFGTGIAEPRLSHCISLNGVI